VLGLLSFHEDFSGDDHHDALRLPLQSLPSGS